MLIQNMEIAGVDYVISRGFSRGERPPGLPTGQPCDQRTNPGAGGVGFNLADVLIILTYLLPRCRYYISTPPSNLIS